MLIEQFLLQLYAEADPTTTDRDAVPREILVPVLPSSAESLTRMLTERAGVRAWPSGCRSAGTSGR